MPISCHLRDCKGFILKTFSLWWRMKVHSLRGHNGMLATKFCSGGLIWQWCSSPSDGLMVTLKVRETSEDEWRPSQCLATDAKSETLANNKDVLKWREDTGWCRNNLKLSWWASKDAMHFEIERVMAVQGHPRWLVSVSTESVYYSTSW